MSKAFLKQRTNGCDTIKPILFEKFFASAMCIRQVYECNLLNRYILCVVVLIVCNEHWEQGIQIELTCNSKLFSLYPLLVSTPSELYPYTLLRTELFHSDCLSELPI